MLVIVPVGAVLGETCAWLSKRVDVLARRENRRANDLEQLTRLAGQLPGLASAQEAADLVARAAVDLFDGAAVSVELSDADGAPVLAEAGDDPATRAGTATQVSLVGRTQVIGVVHLGLRTDDEDPGGYTANLTRLFASQVGNALEQFQLINRLNRAAHRDELTGTGNRRHADALLDSLRPNDALLIVDLDHFKSVNDNLGHRAGDEVLQALGSYLLSYVRGSDDVARYGGDEFVVLARGAGTEARATAERLLLGLAGFGQLDDDLHRCRPALRRPVRRRPRSTRPTPRSTGPRARAAIRWRSTPPPRPPDRPAARAEAQVALPTRDRSAVPAATAAGEVPLTISGAI